MSTRGTSTEHLPDWRESAACTGRDPDFMFPDPGNRRATEQAQALCLVCPVRQECLDAVMAAEGSAVAASRYGVFGGLTPLQRERLYSSSRPSYEQRTNAA
ncbi:WhiB family transcriptional regulator [Streptomyces sp. NPDC014779]|uniref:WhiB family transcriptional regulator n=1 Tax=Streptomyces sp. NPDC014779 TaxID=3364911 RepID=UPI0037034522